MSDGIKRIFAKNLTRYIAQSGKTQKELADMLGVAQSTFNNWCTGVRYPRMDKVEQLADYFGIKKSDLIEERLTEEKEKDNDLLADIIVRMRTDDDFSAAVKAMHALGPSKIKSVGEMLRAFSQ